MREFCRVALLLVTGFPGAAVAATNDLPYPGPGPQEIARIDYRLSPQSPTDATFGTPDKGGENEPASAGQYRSLSPTPPLRQQRAEGPTVALHRTLISLDPRTAASASLLSIRPVTRVGRFALSVERSLGLWTGTKLTLGWQATRLAIRDGAIIADGGPAYRRQRGDLFQPALTLRSGIAPGLNLEISHGERLRANTDSALFGPRPTTLIAWETGDRKADFERSLTDRARLSWEGAALDLSAHIGRASYHNRMIADARGLLRGLSGASRSRDYGIAARWRIAPHLRLSASARTEELDLGTAAHRTAFSAGLEQQNQTGGLRLHLLREGVMHFHEALPGWRPAWGVEAAVERAITGPEFMPDMRLTMRARSLPDMVGLSPDSIASRDLQPQIRVDLRARW